jgi:hypothetical protein
VLGRRNSVSTRRVENENAAARCRFKIDIVHSHPRAPDDSQFFRGIEHFGGHFCFAANDHSREFRNDFDQLRQRQFGLDRNPSAPSRESSSMPRWEIESATRTF